MQIDKRQAEERHQPTETKRDGVQPSKHHEQHPSSPASPTLSPSFPSPEFSFANPPPSVTTGRSKTNPPHPLSVDLSPADEIFFRGHLLPLHLLSRLPVSPRLSTNSSDSSILPAKESPECNCSRTAAPRRDPHTTDTTSTCDQERSLLEGRGSTGKIKSGSLFGLPRWGKEEEAHLQEGQKRKSKFDTSHFLQKYMRLIKPFIVSLKKRRSGDSQIHRQNHSLSGNLRFRNKLKGLTGRRECSAPTSMRNSPTNSGVLVGGGNNNNNNTSGGHGTMEELQAAIQAAIAHCKNSIAAEEKNKQP
ncbi:hypothetical protein OROGR_026310 [Orobanche gracilis]